MNDMRLQELYQQMLDAREHDPRASCPAPEDVQALVEREGTEQERLATLDHVMACRACQREFELLRSLRRAAPEERRWRPATLALAASIVIAISAGVLGVRTLNEAQGPVVRGGGESGIQLIDPTGAVRVADRLALHWHAVPQAVSYTVEVLTADGSVVSGGETADTVLVLPDSVHLATSRRYLWWVRARLSDGSEQRSSMQAFTVKP
jgi:hypothetical protein